MDSSIHKIVDRIADIFCIFDFSFLISGVATFFVLYYEISEYGLLEIAVDGVDKVVVSILLIYICGLISFVIGKSLRKYLIGQKRINQRFLEIFNQTVRYCQSEEHSLIVYDSLEECKLYYTEMWFFLRQTPEASKTLTFINRYWVMQATYEGLAFSFLLGSIIEFVAGLFSAFMLHALIAFILVVGGIFCFYEGTRYAESQISEVVIAYKNLKE